MNILVVQGHPYSQSFTKSNADNYAKVAEEKGNNIKVVDLSSSNFDPVLRYGYHQHMTDEEEPNAWQKLIKWADHIAFFFPVWWSAEPSVLKGFIDRTFTPKFAYTYDKKTGKKIKLLTGKTADIFTSSNAPSFFYSKIYGNVVSRWKHFVLGFVGIKLVHGFSLGSIDKPSVKNEERQAYIEKCAHTIPHN